MNEEFFKKIIAELIESHQAALGLVVSAITAQLDAERLATDLRAQIAAARQINIPPLAIQQATHALAAVDAAIQLKKITH